jgi:hypothetical protein
MEWLINAFIAALKMRPVVTDTQASVETDPHKQCAAIAQTQPALLLLSSDMRRHSLSAEAIARQASKSNPRNAKNAAAAARVLTILNKGN